MATPHGQLRRVFRYGVIGVSTNASLYFVFLLLLQFDWGPTLAAGVCYGLGVGMSYLINRSWTFSSRDGHRRDLPKFLVAYAIGLASTVLTINVLMIWLPARLAQVINIGLTAMVIYGSLIFFRFGHIRDRDAH